MAQAHARGRPRAVCVKDPSGEQQEGHILDPLLQLTKIEFVEPRIVLSGMFPFQVGVQMGQAGLRPGISPAHGARGEGHGKAWRDDTTGEQVRGGATMELPRRVWRSPGARE